MHCINPRERFPLHEAFEARITGTTVQQSTQPASAGGEWRVDGFEINDGSRSIVRAPSPDEFLSLTQEQRARVAKASRQNLAQIVSDHHAVPKLVEALQELVDLMEEVRQGEYVPDSFTTQPARIALAALATTAQPDAGEGR
jgi:hypothetical protein